MNLSVLEQKIDEAIANYLAESQSQALETIQRKVVGLSSKKKPESGKQRRKNKTRSKADIDALAQLLLQTVEAQPGNSLQFLTIHLKLKPRQLEAPANRLKRGGRIRVIGKNTNAKYFPATETARRDVASSD